MFSNVLGFLNQIYGFLTLNLASGLKKEEKKRPFRILGHCRRQLQSPMTGGHDGRMTALSDRRRLVFEKKMKVKRFFWTFLDIYSLQNDVVLDMA